MQVLEVNWLACPRMVHKKKNGQHFPPKMTHVQTGPYGEFRVHHRCSIGEITVQI